MRDKICFLKKYYGGDCLHSSNLNSGSQTQPDVDKERSLPKLPEEVDIEVPLVYYQRRLPEGEPKYVRNATAAEVLDFEKASPVKSIGEVESFPVIDETISKDGTTKLVNHSTYNKAATAYNKVKGTPLKVNAALTALDAANFYYEHQDEFDNVVDFAQAYGSEIVDGAVATAETAYEALKEGDLPTLAVTGASLVGIPVVTRTIDNVADSLGIEGVNTTDATVDAISSASTALKETYDAGRPTDNPFLVSNPVSSLITGFIKRWF
jgi:hypothetical protein